jgi:hypothetical protein
MEIARALTIRDEDGWVGQVSDVRGGTVIGSPKGAGPGDSLYCSRAWPLGMVLVTQKGCRVVRSLEPERPPIAPAKARKEAAAALAREEKVRATWRVLH